jgi:hypothetical protein
MERNDEDTGRDKFAHSLLPALRDADATVTATTQRSRQPSLAATRHSDAGRATPAGRVAFSSRAGDQRRRGLIGGSSPLATAGQLPTITLMRETHA